MKLESGDIAILRNGWVFKIHEKNGVMHGHSQGHGDYRVWTFDEYSDNLTHKYRDYDIMSIFKPNDIKYFFSCDYKKNYNNSYNRIEDYSQELRIKQLEEDNYKLQIRIDNTVSTYRTYEEEIKELKERYIRVCDELGMKKEIINRIASWIHGKLFIKASKIDDLIHSK